METDEIFLLPEKALNRFVNHMGMLLRPRRASWAKCCLMFCRLEIVVAALSAFALVMLATQCSYSQSKADFFIVEHPQQLRINNQYQQQVSPDENAGFASFTPFKILNRDDMLGDNLTPCMKVELDGRLYFLLKEQNGALVGVDNAGFQSTYNGANVLLDTVEVVSKNGIAFVSPQQNEKSGLPRGVILIRIFRHNDLTYVKSLLLGKFGWVNLDASTEKRDWRVVKNEAPSAAEQLKRVLPNLMLTVQRTNRKLEQLFSHFNAKTSRQQPAPQWRVQTLAAGVVCALETTFAPEKFGESSTLLGKNIESVLLGTNLQVRSSPGRIEIR